MGEGLRVVPDGSLYVNAKICRNEGGVVELTDGLVTFKQPKKSSFLFVNYGTVLTPILPLSHAHAHSTHT